MIELVQSRPDELELDGGDKPRFFQELGDLAKRVQQVDTVLRQVTD